MHALAFTIENTMVRISIGQRVTALRNEQGWTMGQLASKSGLSKGYISDLESGKRNPKELTRVKLAKAFGLSMQEFLADVDYLPGTYDQAMEDDGRVGEYPDLVEFEAMLLATRRTNPRLARLVMRIGRELIEEEDRNYKEGDRPDEDEIERRDTDGAGPTD